MKNENDMFIPKVNNPEGNNENDNKEVPKRGKYQHIAKDGTVNFYDTIEELQEAREAERENSN